MMVAPSTQSSWRLASLLDGMLGVENQFDRDIHGLQSDSRRVVQGDLFVARAGGVFDARRYVDDAIARGAAAVLVEADGSPALLRQGVPVLPVAGLRKQLGALCDRFFLQPSERLRVLGVTGTNGKTSVSHYVAQALEGWQGRRCAVMGTVGNGLIGSLQTATHTTADVVDVHRTLAEFADQDVGACAMEVSSHGLDQGRVDGVRFDVAVFTNISRDHLDYHGDMDSYAACKRRLFQWPGLRYAVINVDDPFGLELQEQLAGETLCIGYSASGNPDASLYPKHLHMDATGLRLQLSGVFGEGSLRSKLLGRFNAANLLAALGVLLSQEMPLDEALQRLGRCIPVPGRMETFGGGARPLVVVDYAHTPDALEQVLDSLSEHCQGQLWCVFGCGGDRDQGKRPLMGAAAERRADRVVITDDNPRSEDPVVIVKHILAGLEKPEQATVIRDRAAAVSHAVRRARPGDVVLVAGKGHEDYQERNGRRLPYSNRRTVNRSLAGWAG